ncbi:MAG: hypothetical protein HY902_20655 [Deltaproteobacteria bacterium]|nr:hypothetical protein [Deltaproteobacteria bacterium]
MGRKLAKAFAFPPLRPHGVGIGTRRSAWLAWLPIFLIASACGSSPAASGTGSSADIPGDSSDGSGSGDASGTTDGGLDGDGSGGTTCSAATDPCSAKGLVCDTATGQCVTCVGDEHCPKGQFCTNHSCGPYSCVGKAATCKSPITGQVCDAASGQWKDVPCFVGQVCSGGVCAKPQICVPDTKACSGNKVTVCDKDGTAATTLEDCSTAGGICENAACVSGKCQSGQVGCVGTQVAFCDETQTWQVVGDCAPKGTCVGGDCQFVPCTPGGTTCMGGQVVECDSAGGFKILENCTQKGMACVQAACKPQVCAPNTTGCNGDIMQYCDENGAGWIEGVDCTLTGGGPPGAGTGSGFCADGQCQYLPCAPGGVGCLEAQVVQCDVKSYKVLKDCADTPGMTCDNGSCVAQVCSPWDAFCDGPVAKMCNFTGSGWEQEQDCAAIGMACAGGKCTKMPCAVGEFTCMGTGLYSCTVSGPQLVDDCGQKGEICLNAMCVPPTCPIGQTECDGNVVMYCDGAQWMYSEDCANMGMACIDGACSSMPCAAGGFGCVSNQVVQCDSAGKGWSVVDDCPAQGKVCGNGSCMTAVCAPGMPSCQGNSIAACNESGSGWTTPGEDCTKTGKICDTGWCVASVCTAGTKGCLGAKTVSCASDGGSWQAQACPSGQTCSGSTCQTPTCKPPTSFAPDAVWMHLPVQDKITGGCDLDGNGTIDNAMAKMAGFVIAGAQGPYPGPGQYVLVLQASGFDATGKSFELAVLPALPAAGGMDCQPFVPTTQTCKLQADPAGFDLKGSGTANGTCQAKTVLAATVSGGKLKAGGKGAELWLPSKAAPTPMFFALKDGRIEADVPAGTPWQAASKGHLCGWLTASDIGAIVDDFPLLAVGGGMDAATLKQLIFSEVTPDIDSDGDGKADAYSLGVPFGGNPVQLSAP